MLIGLQPFTDLKSGDLILFACLFSLVWLYFFNWVLPTKLGLDAMSSVLENISLCMNLCLSDARSP